MGAWERLRGCPEDAAACDAIVREAAMNGGRLALRDAALFANVTTTVARGLCGRLADSGLAVVAGDAVYLLPIKGARK